MSAGGGPRWTGRAPAKVNLRLEVLAREETGFHQIETEFQALELADGIEIVPGPPGGVELEVEGEGAGALGPTASNLAVRAVEAFREALGGDAAAGLGVRIRLEKRIPARAGLGGGSSDAAAVLLGLNEALDRPLPGETLLTVGARLGSDVPFFLSGHPRVLAWGRGDRMLGLSPLPPRPVLLLLPDPGIETAWAYGVLARHRARGEDPQGHSGPGRGSGGVAPGPSLLSVGGGEGWDAVAARARNDFEDALAPHRPEIAALRDALRGAGAAPALLSGSGAAIFGIFPDEASLERGVEAARAVRPGLRVLRSRTLGGEARPRDGFRRGEDDPPGRPGDPVSGTEGPTRPMMHGEGGSVA